MIAALLQRKASSNHTKPWCKGNYRGCTTNGWRREMKKSKASLIPITLSSFSTPLKWCMVLQNLALVHCSLQTKPVHQGQGCFSWPYCTWPDLPIIEELDNPPSPDVVREAIKQMSNGKAPKRDGISAEIFKALSNEALKTFLGILVSIWELEEMPTDLRDATIVALFMNKG